jgi:hypothetical protein
VERYDRVCVRNGTAGLFLAFEPLAGWRHVAITEGRERGDPARFVAAPLVGRYAEAGKLVPVLDQLDTRSPASPYETFPPEQAERPADRLEIHRTPEHGSWLSMAGIELGALARHLPERVGAGQRWGAT